MSDPYDTAPRRSDLPRRLDVEAPSSGRSTWPWLAALVIILALLGLGIGFNRTEQASNSQSNPPTTTGAAPSEPRLAPPANSSGDASQPVPTTPAPATPTPNEGPR
jgi:hypothetical protein